jgi:hypothetical protein
MTSVAAGDSNEVKQSLIVSNEEDLTQLIIERLNK